MFCLGLCQNNQQPTTNNQQPTTSNQQPAIKNEEKIQVPIRNPFLEQLGKIHKPEIGKPKQGTNGGQK